MNNLVAPQSLELAKGYLSSNPPKDAPLSEEMENALYDFAADAAMQGDTKMCDHALDMVPMDAAFFLELRMLLPKETVAEIVDGMNMSKVVALLGENYL